MLVSAWHACSTSTIAFCGQPSAEGVVLLSGCSLVCVLLYLNCFSCLMAATRYGNPCVSLVGTTGAGQTLAQYAAPDALTCEVVVASPLVALICCWCSTHPMLRQVTAQSTADQLYTDM
jgi:hypothetical protein